MDPRLLAQLLASQSGQAQGQLQSQDPNQDAEAQEDEFGPEFFKLSPAARLETLKLQEARSRRLGTEFSPTAATLKQLLSRRVEREQALTSAEDARNSPPAEAPQPGFFDFLKSIDPLRALKNQQFR